MNELHATLSRFGWDMRPDLHDAGMTMFDEAREAGELISSTMSDDFTVVFPSPRARLF
jgi:hypothetical protein